MKELGDSAPAGNMPGMFGEGAGRGHLAEGLVKRREVGSSRPGESGGWPQRGLQSSF